MDTQLISGAVCLIAAVISFSWWKRYRDRDLVWFSAIGTFVFLTALVNHLLKYSFGITSTLFLIVNLMFVILNCILFILLIRIAAKMTKRKE